MCRETISFPLGCALLCLCGCFLSLKSDIYLLSASSLCHASVDPALHSHYAESGLRNFTSLDTFSVFVILV